MLRITGVALTVALLAGPAHLMSPAQAASPGSELVGTSPPEWQLGPWINSEPASAAALNEFHERFQDDGLVVLGLYHHKAPTPLYAREVERYAATLGFEFPVAIDREWRTLRSWWLEGGSRGFTSVTFLLDRSGVVRHVHPGGKYVRGDGGFEALEAKIRELLGEPSPATR
jgi:hypothetical protein